MPNTSQQSLHQLLADVHAHRVATFDPKVLQINIDQRALLVETEDATRYPKVGDVIPGFNLEEVNEGALTLEQLVENGPAVLIFFRFAGCPACNIALPYYQRALAPELKKLGATLIAISPQIPERLVDIKVRHQFDFRVTSDIDNALGRRLGILYSANDASRKASIASGKTIGEVIGTGTWELPMPTVLIIDHERVVRFVDVSPDWLVRTEADVILTAVRAIIAAEQQMVAG